MCNLGLLEKQKAMTKYLKNILTAIILGCLIWYLVAHWQQLAVLLQLTPKNLLMLYSLLFLTSLATTRAVQSLLTALCTKTCFWDMLWLQNASLLLNYAPMKFGTLFRANYLKRHYNLSYSHFTAFFLYITFLMTATAAAIGLVVLSTIYGVGEYENKIMTGVFIAVIIGSLCFLSIRLPIPKSSGRLMSALRNFLTGRKHIVKQRKAILVSFIFLLINFLLTAARLWIIYRSMNIGINPAGCLVLGALGYIALFISLTPGSLGIRELLLGAGAVVLGVPLEVGILAAMIDRAIVMSYTFIIGGSCTLWLWHKSSADFKTKAIN